MSTDDGGGSRRGRDEETLRLGRKGAADADGDEEETLPLPGKSAGPVPGPVGQGPGPVPAEDEDDAYVATVLDSGWGVVGGTPEHGPAASPAVPGPGSAAGPAGEDVTRELPSPEGTRLLEPGAGATRPLEPGPEGTRPLEPGPEEARGGADDGEVLPGGVLRFGPGPPPPDPHGSGAAAVWHGEAPPPDRQYGGQQRKGRRRVLGGLRRYLLAALVLAAVAGYLLWQRLGTELAVTGVEVYTESARPGCGETVEVVGVVRTNGEPGTLTYQWIRSDGTTAEPLQERLPQGQEEVRMRLFWTFRGEGTVAAEARLRLLSPVEETLGTEFTYRCAAAP